MRLHDDLVEMQKSNGANGFTASKEVVHKVLDEDAFQKYNSTPPDRSDMLALDPKTGFAACWFRALEAVKKDAGQFGDHNQDS